MGATRWGLGALALFAALAVIAFTVAGLGRNSAFAQTPFKRDPGRYEELLAQKLGITVERLREAQKAARDQMIDDAVADGQLTQEQAARLKSKDVGAARGLALGRGGALLHALNAVRGAGAEAIGVPREELSQELRAGKSLAEIAGENNIDRDDLEERLRKSLGAAIDKAEAEGHVTADQASRLKQAVDQRIDEIIEHEGGLKGRGLRFR